MLVDLALGGVVGIKRNFLNENAFLFLIVAKSCIDALFNLYCSTIWGSKCLLVTRIPRFN